MRNRRRIFASFVVTMMTILLVVLMGRLRTPRNEAEAVAWNREICAQCGMVVGDRNFAAQLRTRDGLTLNFDDPGCLMSFLQQRHPAVQAIYVRNAHADNWLPEAEAAFIRVPQSPSGYDLAAVARNTPGALSWAEAMRIVQQRNQSNAMGGNHVQP